MPGKRSHGEGQLRQRPDGRWELTLMIGYQPDGRRKLKSFYGKTQKEVKEKGVEFRKALEMGISTEELIFAEWADKWYAGYKDSVSVTTYENYRYTLALLKDVFGPRKLRSIKPMDVEKYLRGLREEGRSDSYMTKSRGMLFQILHKAEANDLILKNPVRFADKMKRTKGHEKTKDAFTREEINLLMAELPTDRFGYSIRLMIVTGMRPQEMLGLQPEHIEPDGSMLYIRQAVKLLRGTPFIGDTKSFDSVRDIPVPESFRYIAVWLREQAGVFVLDREIPGLPMNPQNFREKFKSAVSKVEGVRLLTPHCCRHTYITQLQNAGVDMETIKALAGHADVEMTGHYVHVQREAMTRAAAKLSGALSEEITPQEIKSRQKSSLTE